MPCTVGQITKAEQIEDKFLIGNIELNQVLEYHIFSVCSVSSVTSLACRPWSGVGKYYRPCCASGSCGFDHNIVC